MPWRFLSLLLAVFVSAHVACGPTALLPTKDAGIADASTSDAGDAGDGASCPPLPGPVPQGSNSCVAGDCYICLARDLPPNCPTLYCSRTAGNTFGQCSYICPDARARD